MYKYTLNANLALWRHKSLVPAILLVVVANGIPVSQIKGRVTKQLVGMLQPVQSEFIRDSFAVVVGMVNLFRFLACIDSEQQTIRRRQNIGELLHK